MAATQRRFAIMGDNLFSILNKLTENQRLCRLLKYQNTSPFSKELENVDGTDLINKQLIIVPKIPENDDKECSFIVVVFDKYIVNPNNDDFKLCTLRFEIVCPMRNGCLTKITCVPTY